MAKEQITGLIVTDKSVEWTTMLNANGRVDVVSFGSEELTGPTLPPVQRPVVEESEDAPVEEAVAAEEEQSVSDLIKDKCSKIKGAVSVGLESEHLLLRVVNLPVVDHDELKGMVELQVDKISPFPIESMVVSQEVLKRDDDGLLVLVAAVKEEVVKACGDVLRDGGLRSSRVDIAIMARLQLMRDDGAIIDEGRQIVMVMDGAVPEIVVLQDGVPIILRPLLGVEGLEGDRLIGEIAQEVGYTLMTLEREHGSAEVAGFVVWNRDDVPDGLLDTLAKECSCEVAVRSLKELSGLSEGLARRLAGMDESMLNLTPVSWLTEEQSKIDKKKTLGLVAGVFGVWALALLVVFGSLYYKEGRLKRLAAEATEWNSKASLVRAMRRRVSMMKLYTDKSRSALECLRTVSMIKPAQLDLTEFNYTKGEKLKVSGKSLAVDPVYTFKTKIDEQKLESGEKMFVDAELTTLRNVKGKELFSIEILLSGGDE